VTPDTEHPSTPYPTHDGTCPACGRRLRGLRNLDWLAASEHIIKCECGARVSVTVGFVYRAEVKG